MIKRVIGMGIAGLVLASFSAYSSIQQPLPQGRGSQGGECVSSPYTPQKIDKDCIEEIIRRGQCIEYETRTEETDYIEVSRTTLHGPIGETYENIEQGLQELKNPTRTVTIELYGTMPESCLRAVKEEGYCHLETVTLEQKPYKQTRTTFRYGPNEK